MHECLTAVQLLYSCEAKFIDSQNTFTDFTDTSTFRLF